MEPSRPTPSIEPSVREFLDLDRSLPPSDRKLVAHLLTHPRTVTARELSAATGTNLQALYGALDRLERRGFLVRAPVGGPARFRLAHPSVVLQVLLAPGKRAVALATSLEGPLREIHERGADPPPEPRSGSTVASTRSPIAAEGWLLERFAETAGDVWVLGAEAPWSEPLPDLAAEVARIRLDRPAGRVRFLVPPADPRDERSGSLERLSEAGADVRHSTRFRSSTIVFDRRWLMVADSSARSRRAPDAVYLRIDSLELASDLVRSAEEEWPRASISRASVSRFTPRDRFGEATAGPPGGGVVPPRSRPTAGTLAAPEPLGGRAIARR